MRAPYLFLLVFLFLHHLWQGFDDVLGHIRLSLMLVAASTPPGRVGEVTVHLLQEIYIFERFQNILTYLRGTDRNFVEDSVGDS
jgi:hypothetical protein